MKKAKLIFSIIVLTGLIFFFYKFDSWHLMSKVNGFDFVFLTILTIVIMLFLGAIFKIEVKIFNIKLAFKHWFGLTMTNTFYNYFMPMRGGLAARAFFMKKHHDFSYSEYSSMLIGSTLVNFLICAIVACLFSFLLINEIKESTLFIEYSLLVFGFTLCLILFSVLSNKLTSIFKWKFVQKILNSFNASIKRYVTNKYAFFLLLALNFTFIFLMSIRLYYVFQILDVQIGFLTILVIRSLVVFSMVISLTPGNFGISEGIIAFLALQSGVDDLDTAILVATIDRFFSIIVNVIFGVFYHFKLLRELSM
jgi:uncharacterized protein (TIRG00374 family)